MPADANEATTIAAAASTTLLDFGDLSCPNMTLLLVCARRNPSAGEPLGSAHERAPPTRDGHRGNP